MKSFRQLLDHQAEINPENIALNDGLTKLSFKELQKLSIRLGAELSILSSNAKPVIQLQLSRKLPELLLLYAAAYNEFPLILSSARASTAEVLRQQELLKPSIVISEHSDVMNALDGYQATMLSECAELKLIMNSPLKIKLRKNAKEFAVPYELIIFTSGSSSEPKAVAHKISNFLKAAEAANSVLNISSESHLALVLGAAHAGGLAQIFRALLVGAKISTPQAEGLLALDAAAKFPLVSHLSLTATQMDQLLAMTDHTSQGKELCRWLSSIKNILIGGSSISGKQIRHYLNSALNIKLSYGMSEAASTIAICDLQKIAPSDTTPPQLLASPLPHINISISKGSDAEILIESPALLLGYMLSEIDLKARQSPFHTGDLGEMKNGKLILKGRKDRMYISGGANIYPEEIEALLEKHATVKNACVRVISSKKWGQTAFAIVIIKSEEAKPSSKELRNFLLTHLAAFKVPRHYLIIPESSTNSAITKKLELIS